MHAILGEIVTALHEIAEILQERQKAAHFHFRPFRGSVFALAFRIGLLPLRRCIATCRCASAAAFFAIARGGLIELMPKHS